MAESRTPSRFALGAAGLLLALALALMMLLAGFFGGSAEAKKKHGYSPYRGGFQISESSIQVSASNQINSQLYTPCPAWRTPYGGEVSVDHPPNGTGQGVFPLAKENRGQQKDVHFVLMLFNPGGPLAPFNVTGQTVCGPKPYKRVAVQNIVQVDPGQTQTVISTCPPGRTLIGGNFARTYFTPQGGDFVTQSRGDIANNSWVVSATAFGSFGGPVADTAFCAKLAPPKKAKSLGELIELAAETGIDTHATGEVTTPACPPGASFVWGGFSESPQGSVMYAGGYLSENQSYSAYGYNRSNARATFDYFSYCLQTNAFRGAARKP
jgi:hypothetical protein